MEPQPINAMIDNSNSGLSGMSLGLIIGGAILCCIIVIVIVAILLRSRNNNNNNNNNNDNNVMQTSNTPSQQHSSLPSTNNDDDAMYQNIPISPQQSGFYQPSISGNDTSSDFAYQSLALDSAQGMYQDLQKKPAPQ
jgi:predicted lipid-binding transport protein (Tim44 family)